MPNTAIFQKTPLISRGLLLEYFTILWSIVEAAVAVGSSIITGSIALIGLGLDSLIEIFAGGVLIWKLRKEGCTDQVREIC